MPKRNFEQGIALLLLVQLPAAFSDVGLVDYVVSVENLTGFVPADLHRYGFRDTELAQVPYPGPAKIMEDQANVLELLTLPLLAANRTSLLGVNRLLFQFRIVVRADEFTESHGTAQHKPFTGVLSKRVNT
ncbi:MAG: hypothetical protein WBQ74_11445 [Candidatus Sulfotelmatobacter sp.]